LPTYYRIMTAIMAQVAVLSHPGLIMVAVIPPALLGVTPHHVAATNLLPGLTASVRPAGAASLTIVAEVVVAAARDLLPGAHPRLLTITPLPVADMAGAAAATIILQEAGVDMMRIIEVRVVAGGTTMNPTEDAR